MPLLRREDVSCNIASAAALAAGAAARRVRPRQRRRDRSTTAQAAVRRRRRRSRRRWSAAEPAGHEELSAGRDPRGRIDLCGRRAGQAGGRQRRALSGHDRATGARMHDVRRTDERAYRHPGPHHRRSCGRAAAVDMPIRVAVVQEGVGRRRSRPRPIARRSISPDGNVPFSFVAEDLVFRCRSAGRATVLRDLYRLRSATGVHGEAETGKKKKADFTARPPGG